MLHKIRKGKLVETDEDIPGEVTSKGPWGYREEEISLANWKRSRSSMENMKKWSAAEEFQEGWVDYLEFILLTLK